MSFYPFDVQKCFNQFVCNIKYYFNIILRGYMSMYEYVRTIQRNLFDSTCVVFYCD